MVRQSKTAKITDQISDKIELLTSKRQNGISPEGGGDDASRMGAATAVLVGGRTRQRPGTEKESSASSLDDPRGRRWRMGKGEHGVAWPRIGGAD
jgi:hypothetical protein